MYLKIAWRNMMKNKIFSFINVFGLAVGLTSFILIALYIFDELTFDRFHSNAANIYRIVEDNTSADGKETKLAGVAYQISERAKIDLPGVTDFARITGLGRSNVAAVGNTNVFYEDFFIANQGFLTAFDFKLLQGDRKTALTEPHTVIVTEETALKLFNSVDVLGKTVKIDRDSMPCRITAVLKKFPVNSHLSFNLIFSEATVTGGKGFSNFVNKDWNSNYFATYLVMGDKANPHITEAAINKLVSANRGSDNKSRSKFTLQPLKDIHFYSAGIQGGLGRDGNISYIYIFSIVALFVLLIACINYVNLTTARFANRAKEIAVRKVAGALQKDLVTQFLIDALLITVTAFILAFALVQIMLPVFNRFTGKTLSLGLATDYRIWMGVIAVIIGTGLLAGIYPAFVQSRLKPLLLLKSKLTVGKGTLSLRRSLVVFQFTLSIIMIVATIVVYRQMQYVNTKDMGFAKDHLVVVDINSGKVRRNAEAIKTEFAKLGQVSAVSVTSRVPGEWKSIPRVKVRNEKIKTKEGSDMYFLGVDNNFLQTYQVKLLNGRNFMAGNVADSAAVLINETAAKELGITEASEQLVEIPAADFDGAVSPLDEVYKVRVVGIVKDFNFQSLRDAIAPMVLGFQKNPVQSIDYFTGRVTNNNVAGTLDKMDAILHKFDNSHLFEYHFLDKQWDLFYREDAIRQTIFLVFSVITILIACLGLFGLATYAAEQRFKEIGIRKVLGASVGGIVMMLSKDFLKLVLIAACVAFPVAWWASNTWLQGFAYKVDVSWWIFLLSGTMAAAIALFTISCQAIKAAIANPVKSLRAE